MGSRGPQPTPTAILALRGSTRAGMRQAEPEADGATPSMPAWLTPRAKAAWKYAAPRLQAMGVLSSLDRLALARYCDTAIRWREAVEWIADDATSGIRTAIDGNDNTLETEHPMVKRAERLADQLRKDERLFGLSPAFRAGLAKPKSNPLENRGKGRFLSTG